MNTKELIEQAMALPVEERALVVDSLLQSLNPLQSEIDVQWAVEAKRRLAELRSGKVEVIPGEAVFERVRERTKRVPPPKLLSMLAGLKPIEETLPPKDDQPPESVDL